MRIQNSNHNEYDYVIERREKDKIGSIFDIYLFSTSVKSNEDLVYFKIPKLQGGPLAASGAVRHVSVHPNVLQ